jgi:DNA helicase-2/ATP-dependent DNA helicase PcrA
MTIAYQQALNEEQFRAATAPDGPALVLAAAGTGKTRTLVYRVAYLVEQGIAPERILLLTFTNRAAHEMLERATQLVGAHVGGMWGGTFHHMANRVLRRHAALLGFSERYSILDRDDARSLVSTCLKDLGLNHKEFPKRDVLLDLFGTTANSGKDIEAAVQDRFEALEVDPADVMKVHRAYRDRKRALDAMDFDDLLTTVWRLFVDHPDVLALYRQRFLHVLVDEFQDTNSVQARLVDALAAEYRNLFVVGDDFQSIYAWRGADYRNILSFPERYAGTRIFRLETNYRSVPEVLAVANACIAGNPRQFQKVLRPTRDAGRKPKVVFVRDGEDQARAVSAEIESLRRDGYRLSEIAVLYRAHFHAMELQVHLGIDGVPYVITSGIRFFEQAHIKDVCALLRLLEHNGDGLAFERLMGLLNGVGPKTAEKIWRTLGGHFDLRDAARRALVREGLRSTAREEWDRIGAAAAACGTPGATPSALVEAFVGAFYAAYAEATFDNAERRIEDITEMAAYADKFETLERFLGEVALLTNLDAEAENMKGEGEQDAVRLSTVHQAKGLEWRAVILLWMTEGMFPSPRSVEDGGEEGEAEERRLFYVAVTRARDTLTMCVPQVRRMRDGGVFYCRPSRFLAELPRGLTSEVRPRFY